VDHLRERGHEVRVLTTDWREAEPDPSIPEDPDVHRDLRWYWHDHAFPRMGPLAISRLERHNARTLDRHVEEFRPDAVSWWAMGGMSLSLITRPGLPAQCVVVDDWLLYGPKVDRRARVTRRPTRSSLEGAAGWLFASQTLLDRARENGWQLADAEVVHPGIDLSLFASPPERRSWEWRLLYCGRIDERKGIDLAIDALGHLPGEATLRVVGGGDDEHLTALRDRAAPYGGRVSFERLPRSELPRVYADADATLFPVRWDEPFGLVPLESMAMGTPVVASGRGGSAEYLRDGENCLLADPDSGPEALAAAVRRLASEPALSELISRQGAATAARYGAERFDSAVEGSLSRRRQRGGS
jgi:glycosyltransferase involved in cell wall biosynthesis